MKIQNVKDPRNVSTIDDLTQYTSTAIRNILNVVNGNVDLVDNCPTDLVTVQFTLANKDVNVPHTLGVVPRGYIEVRKSVNMVIFDGTSGFNANSISVQSNAKGHATLLVF